MRDNLMAMLFHLNWLIVSGINFNMIGSALNISNWRKIILLKIYHKTFTEFYLNIS